MLKQLLFIWIPLTIAIAITATMDFTGLTMFSALPLFVVTSIYWYFKKYTKQDMGIRWGRWKFYGLALLYPLSVLGIVTLVCYFSGAMSIDINWRNTGLNILAGTTIGTLMVFITEEGFFRGLLWAVFSKNKISESSILVYTTLAFMLWHISAVTAESEYGLPIKQVPIYLINVILLGLIWGRMRLLSGSVLVASFSHATWNALAYDFYGFGKKIGSFGVENTMLFGPEIGILGIVLNGLFYLLLLKFGKSDSA